MAGVSIQSKRAIQDAKKALDQAIREFMKDPNNQTAEEVDNACSDLMIEIDEANPELKPPPKSSPRPTLPPFDPGNQYG